MKLMRATSVQLSPIFGLFPDDKHEVNKLLYASVGKPEVEGTLDGVRHQLWSIHDAQVEHQVIDLMKRKKIYIADGHSSLYNRAWIQSRNGSQAWRQAACGSSCEFLACLYLSACTMMAV